MSCNPWFMLFSVFLFSLLLLLFFFLVLLCSLLQNGFVTRWDGEKWLLLISLQLLQNGMMVKDIVVVKKALCENHSRHCCHATTERSRLLYLPPLVVTFHCYCVLYVPLLIVLTTCAWFFVCCRHCLSWCCWCVIVWWWWQHCCVVLIEIVTVFWSLVAFCCSAVSFDDVDADFVVFPSCYRWVLYRRCPSTRNLI